jgi:hypothetical protein
LRWLVLCLGNESTVCGLGLRQALGKRAQCPVGLQPVGRGRRTHRRPVVAPGPVARLSHHAGTHGIQHDVAGKLEQIRLLLHQDRLVTALKDVPDSGVHLVEALRVDAIELAHALREIGVGRFRQQMVVVSHLAIGMDGPIEALADLVMLESKDILIMDRNFCARDFLHGIAARDAYFICRQHQGLPWQEDGEECLVGHSRSGAVYEQGILVSDSDGHTRRLRRIGIILKKATRDGDKELTLLTNLPKSAAHATHIAWMYRKRWTIETAFPELEAHLHSEINALGYPKAALFGFCIALLAYNVLAVVKAALRSMHGEEKIADAVSGDYLAGHLARTYDGMMIAIPDAEWRIFERMSTKGFIEILQQLARKVDLAKFRSRLRLDPSWSPLRCPKIDRRELPLELLVGDRRVRGELIQRPLAEIQGRQAAQGGRGHLSTAGGKRGVARAP